MRVLVVENYPKTTLGLVGKALAEAGAECRVAAHACRRQTCRPRTTASMRSSCSAARRMRSTTRTIPICQDEAALARAFGEADKAVLGICLGAQTRRPRPRRGEHPRPADRVRLARGAPDRGRAAPIRCSRRSATAAPLFHWHLDTFTLPPGAVHLARASRRAMQAFRIGRAVYGIQFHFEAGTELVASWTRDFADEIERLRARLVGAPSGRGGEARRGGRRRRPGAGARLDRAASVHPPQAGAEPG